MFLFLIFQNLFFLQIYHQTQAELKQVWLWSHIIKDNLKWHHSIKCYVLLKMSQNHLYCRDCISVSIAQVQLYSKCQSDKCAVVEPLCVCVLILNRWLLKLFDSGTGEKAICRFFPSGKEKKSARVRNLSHDANVKTTVCPIR